MHNIIFYNSMKYIQICMDCFHICMDCLYSLYELSPQNFCRGNPYNFFKLNISLILLIWRYSGICQSTVNTWSIVLYHRFILRLFCWILVNVFPLVVWIVPTLPYIYINITPAHFCKNSYKPWLSPIYIQDYRKSLYNILQKCFFL